MPIYEYECSCCHSHFEQKQGFNDDPVADCPRCRGKAQRLISAVTVIYKGSGFYTTDHARGSGTATETKKETAEGDKKAEKTTEAKAESKAESKAAEKKS